MLTSKKTVNMRQVLEWQTGQSCVGASQIGPPRNQSETLALFGAKVPVSMGRLDFARRVSGTFPDLCRARRTLESFIPEAAPLYLAALIVAGRRAEIVCNLNASSNLQ